MSVASPVIDHSLEVVSSMSLALAGSGGAGVVTAAELLLQAAARAGWYGRLSKSFGPQIRGGETCAYLTFADRPVDYDPDRFDLFLALDWLNVERYVGDISLDENSLVIAAGRDGDLPAALAGRTGCHLDLEALAKSEPGLRPNMLALGLLAEMLALPEAAVGEVLAARFHSKGADAVTLSQRAVDLGRAEAAAIGRSIGSIQQSENKRWLISGNQAVGLGALRGGVRFVAAYPITPATEILEWMAPRLPDLGGLLVQAEDELASINMTIGAAYAGKVSMTATSGPGLALMSEAIGLAVAAEVPLVVANVMRGGPSTGIPTKSEQSDLNLAVYGLHGDAPHIVLAPLGIRDAVRTAELAVAAAENRQTPVILLSDQYIGQGMAIVDAPPPALAPVSRKLAEPPTDGYHRYAVTEDGVSPMSLPGMPGGQYTADGLEHTPRGLPSSTAAHHLSQMDKRAAKIAGYDAGEDWIELDGETEAPVLLLTWGSSYAPALAAARRLDPDGAQIRVAGLRQLAPARPDLLAPLLAPTVITLEQSHSGQFHQYLRAAWDLLSTAKSVHRAGPIPFRVGELTAQLEDMLS